mmetsp:Transcript_46862/g.74606  ORF Transcript_46862/g.74606 Transcript_46862/m.74606 type:complete len:110 (+) Transcript_46862:986-1315(+)
MAGSWPWAPSEVEEPKGCPKGRPPSSAQHSRDEGFWVPMAPKARLAWLDCWVLEEMVHHGFQILPAAPRVPGPFHGQTGLGQEIWIYRIDYPQALAREGPVWRATGLEW